MESVNSPHAKYKYWHLSIACTLMAFLAATSTSYLPYTQGKARPPQYLIDSCLHHTHHFPLSHCQACSCYHRGAGIDIYTPLLATASAASDSLPPTEAQALASSHQTEYPTTPENSRAHTLQNQHHLPNYWSVPPSPAH